LVLMQYENGRYFCFYHRRHLERPGKAVQPTATHGCNHDGRQLQFGFHAPEDVWSSIRPRSTQFSEVGRNKFSVFILESTR
jgi:hypothetical protein